MVVLGQRTWSGLVKRKGPWLVRKRFFTQKQLRNITRPPKEHPSGRGRYFHEFVQDDRFPGRVCAVCLWSQKGEKYKDGSSVLDDLRFLVIQKLYEVGRLGAIFLRVRPDPKMDPLGVSGIVMFLPVIVRPN